MRHFLGRQVSTVPSFRWQQSGRRLKTAGKTASSSHFSLTNSLCFRLFGLERVIGQLFRQDNRGS